MQEARVIAEKSDVVIGRISDFSGRSFTLIPYFRKDDNQRYVIKVRGMNQKFLQKYQIGSFIAVKVRKDDGDHSCYLLEEIVETSHYATFRGSVPGAVSIGSFTPDKNIMKKQGIFKEDNGTRFDLHFDDQRKVMETLIETKARNLLCYHERGKMIRLEQV